MSKIGLIIRREYLTRVKKRSFIIMTILGPILMGGVIAFSIYLTMSQEGGLSNIKVIDETNQLAEKFPVSKSIIFQKDSIPVAAAREMFNPDEFYGILYIPANAMQHPDSIVLYTSRQPNLTVVSFIESSLQKEVEKNKLSKAGITKEILDSIKTNINIQQKAVSKDAEDSEFSAGITAGAGFVGGLLIYLFIFLYGVQVMRGVMEEKSSRIVEVIISSVRPFQLMMGKIVGIALVGLTQFLLWVVLTFFISTAVSSAMMSNNEMVKDKIERIKNAQVDQSTSQNINAAKMAQPDFMKALSSLNLTKLFLTFIFYFIGGYLLYSALFAAIGAAVDSETDTQQFMLPITIPLILAYIVSVNVMANPESNVGYWFSLIPFTSPVVMMVRMPFDPPLIDILISMFLLVAGFLFTTWMAAKIYRTGILMYGKKITYKELGKWLFYKG